MNINPNKIAREGVIKTSEYSAIQQVGIDVSLKENVALDHGDSKNVLMNETIHLPKDMFALLIHRSTYNRQGIFITGSIYDPGYSGVIGATIYNLSGKLIAIKKNERVAQIVVFKADSAGTYKGKYQNEHLEVTNNEKKRN